MTKIPKMRFKWHRLVYILWTFLNIWGKSDPIYAKKYQESEFWSTINQNGKTRIPRKTPKNPVISAINRTHFISNTFSTEFQQILKQNYCTGVPPEWDQNKIARKGRNFAWIKMRHTFGPKSSNSPHFYGKTKTSIFCLSKISAK